MASFARIPGWHMPAGIIIKFVTSRLIRRWDMPFVNMINSWMGQNRLSSQLQQEYLKETRPKASCNNTGVHLFHESFNKHPLEIQQERTFHTRIGKQQLPVPGRVTGTCSLKEIITIFKKFKDYLLIKLNTINPTLTISSSLHHHKYPIKLPCSAGYVSCRIMLDPGELGGIRVNPDP
jgi:hypothetical protein